MYENTLIFFLGSSVVLTALAYRYASRGDALRRDARRLHGQATQAHLDLERAEAVLRRLRLRHASLVQTVRATDAEAGANLRRYRQWREVVAQAEAAAQDDHNEGGAA